MKKTIILITALLATAFETGVQAKPFTQGNLVIYRIGDGTSALGAGGNYSFLDEVTTNGVLVQSIALPTSQFIDVNGNTNYPIQNSGVATSEGQMTLSLDGRYLVFGGYPTNNSWGGPTGPSLPTSTTVNRLIGRADANGNVDTVTSFGGFISGVGGNIRAVASTDGLNLWAASSTEGIGYIPWGAPGGTNIEVQANNNRGIGIYGSDPYFACSNCTGVAGYVPAPQLYFTSSTRITAIGTNFPTAGAVNTNVYGISTGNGPFQSPYAFVAMTLLPGNTNIDTIYLADEGSNVSKWCESLTQNSASNGVQPMWTSCGSISTSTGPNGMGNVGTFAFGLRGVTASVSVSGSQTNVHLYFISGCGAAGCGYLYTITDSSGYGGSISGVLPAPTATVQGLIPGCSNCNWRSVAFAPSVPANIKSIAKSGNDISLVLNCVANNQYVLQASPGTANGNYSNDYVSISATNNILGTAGIGFVQTNYVETGGATNKPSRYYRVQQVPWLPAP